MHDYLVDQRCARWTAVVRKCNEKGIWTAVWLCGGRDAKVRCQPKFGHWGIFGANVNIHKSECLRLILYLQLRVLAVHATVIDGIPRSRTSRIIICTCILAAHRACGSDVEFACLRLDAD